MPRSPRLFVALVALALPACIHEARSEPVRSPDDPLILPSWATAEPASGARPNAARQRGTVVLGASDAPDGHGASRGRAADAPAYSTQHKFPANDTYGPFRPLYYRAMPQTYSTPGAGASPSSPSTGNSRESPVGRDWPAIPDHGPQFPVTTPVHP